MRNLLPQFIHNKFERGQTHGYLNAITVFVDISGFTSLTETLMQHGKQGAEELTSTINAVFEPIVSYVYAHNGFISTFAGDAFTAIFPIQRKHAIVYAVNSAFFVKQFILNRGQLDTSYGSFEIGVKVGLSFGQVEWGILGQETDRAFYFRGPAIDGCARAEKQAETGHIVADTFLIEQLRSSVRYTKVGTHFLLQGWDRILPPKVYRKSAPAEQETVLRQFEPTAILEFSGLGEFRDVCSIFLAFDDQLGHDDLDRFITPLLPQVKQYGGYFNKIDFGDKGGIALIVFGAPISHENNERRAADWLLTLKDMTLHATWKAGVSSGTVFAGIIGGEERCEYTVIGDQVNTAARLMSYADWGDIWLADSVVGRLRNYHLKAIGDVSLKGKSRQIAVSALAGGAQRRSPEQFEGEMVGRQAELKHLLNLVAKLCDWYEDRSTTAPSGVVVVYGEAGMGKSRLIYEFRKRLTAKISWFFCPADQILRQSFNPFRHFLIEYFDQNLNAGEDENKAAFEQKWNDLNRRIDDINDEFHRTQLVAQLTRFKSILGAQVNLHWPDTLWNQLDAQARYDNTILAIQTLFLAESSLQPLILNIADGHWLDPDSMTLLSSLTKAASGYPILVMISSRYTDEGAKLKFPTIAPPDNGSSLNSEIDLNILSDDDLQQMAEKQLGGKVDPQLFALLRDKTYGNPFFLQQITSYLVENGLLSQKNTAGEQAYALGEIDFQLPGSINAVIMARVDRLSQRVKDVIKTASVIGREFDARLLSTILKRDIVDEVEVAERSNIWNELQELQFIFKHALLRDVVYEMQLRICLRELHQLTAEAIESVYHDRLEQKLADLAFHYEKGAVYDKAAFYLKQAGDQARDNYENQEALQFYDRLLTVLTHLPDKAILSQRIETLLQMNYVLQHIGESERALHVGEDALQLAEQLNNDSFIIRTHRAQGEIYMKKGQHEQALSHFRQSLECAKKSDDTSGISRAIGKIGIVHFYRGAYDEAMTAYQQQLDLSRELGAWQGESKAIGNIGILYALRGDPERAMECFQQKLTICEQHNDKREIATVVGNMGVMYHRGGDYDAALKCYQQSLHANEEIGNQQGVSNGLNNLATLYMDVGDYDRALQYAERCVRISRNQGDRAGIARALSNMASLYHQKKQYTQAITLFDQAIAMGQKIQYLEGLCQFMFHKARTQVTQGAYPEAQKTNAEAQKYAAQIQKQDIYVRTKALEIEIEYNLNQNPSTLTALQDIMHEFTEDYLKAEIHEKLYYYKKEISERAQEAQQHRQEAIRLYQTAIAKTPKQVWKECLAALSKGNTT